jgi:hypothetical protein
MAARPGVDSPDDIYFRARVRRGELQAEHCYPQKERWWAKLREKKNGKLNEMACHHNLEAYLDEYIEAASICQNRKGPLFRSAIVKDTQALGPGHGED